MNKDDLHRRLPPPRLSHLVLVLGQCQRAFQAPVSKQNTGWMEINLQGIGGADPWSTGSWHLRCWLQRDHLGEQMRNTLVDLSEDELRVLKLAHEANDALLAEKPAFSRGDVYRREVPLIVALAQRFHEGVASGVVPTCRECQSELYSPVYQEHRRQILARRGVPEGYQEELDRVLVAHLVDGCAYRFLVRVAEARRNAGLPTAPSAGTT